MRYLFTVLIWLAAVCASEAQSLPPNQPEQEPCAAIQVCGSSFSAPSRYVGTGATFSSAGCISENGSVWLRVEIASAGTLEMNITPINQYDDYDFSVVNITNSSCSTYTNQDVVRCNANNNAPGSSPGGLTGMNGSGTATTVPQGTSGMPFVQSIDAMPGEVYLILINNVGNYADPSTTSSGFTADFSTSTATFVTPPPPLFDTIAHSCDFRTGLTVYMDTNFICSSLQSDGSDFRLSPPFANVTSATSPDCRTITLGFSNQLPPGIYYLKAAIGNDGNSLTTGCNSDQPLTDSIAFRVEAPPVVTTTPDTSTCVNNSIQLHADTSGGPFLSGSFIWLPNTYLNDNTLKDPIATPPFSLDYTVQFIPDGYADCSVFASLHLEVLQGFRLDTRDTAVCAGYPIQVRSFGDQRYQYSWSPVDYVSDPNAIEPLITPYDTKNYTVTASHPGCRDSVLHLNIEVQPYPTVKLGNDTTLCTGESYELRPSITPPRSAFYTYSWTPRAFFDQPDSLNPYFTPLRDTDVVLNVTTPLGCNGTDTFHVSLVPLHFVQARADTALCPGDSVRLFARGAESYAWTPETFNDADSFYVTPDATTIYQVVGTRLGRCLDSDQVRVVVYPAAVLHLPDSIFLLAGQQYQMNPEGNCLYFSWFPPAGLSNTEIANPVVTPEVNTRYFVTAYTEHNCPAYDSSDVFIDPSSFLNVPNAFTPGDNPNNVMRASSFGVTTLKYFRIFNRWGKLMFETSNVDQGWDGTLNGEPQPMGVYVYTFEGALRTGKAVTKQGNITLLR